MTNKHKAFISEQENEELEKLCQERGYTNITDLYEFMHDTLMRLKKLENG